MSEQSDDLAEDRTDLAEDRTLLANERTFAGWMRTGLAAVGIGIGFNAVYRSVEPVWAAKAVASVFIGAGIAVFWLAERRARKIDERLSAHRIRTLADYKLRLIAGVLTVGAAGLLAATWLLV